jgi:hypothetical protein
MKHLWLILCLAVALAGCALEAGTSIDPGGSGNLSTAIGLTAADLQTLAGLGGSTGSDFCHQLEAGSRLPAGGKVTQEEREGATWCTVNVPFRDLPALEALYQQMGNIKVNQLELTDGKFVYDLDVDLSDLTTEGVDPALLSSMNLSIDWKLSPPGTVGDNNADQVQNGALVWHIQMGETAHLHVESQVGGALFPASSDQPGSFNIRSVWVIGLALACLLMLTLIVGATVFLIIRSRRGEKDQA